VAGLTAPVLAARLGRAAAAMRALEDDLNAADGHLGDGDTGQTLRRVLDKVAAAAPGIAPDLTAAFRTLAAASASATGSSLGTLFTVALMTLGKIAAGRQELPWSEIGAALAEARDAMAKRGGASLGDKTVLDAIDAIATATAGLDDPAALRTAALDAARAALDRFRPLPCRAGRARMFAERSIGLDDPGMLAVVRLLEADAG
jgi:dihydroxyacetone kinase-like protein